MKNWTIAKRIIFGFSAVVACMLVLVGVLRFKLEVIAEKSNAITKESLPAVMAASEARFLTARNSVVVFKHIDSLSAEDRESLEQEMAKNSSEVSELLNAYEKTIHTVEERAAYDRLITARNDFTNVRKKIMAQSSKAEDAAARAAVYALARQELDPVARAYGKAYDDLTDAEAAKVKRAEGYIDEAIKAGNLTLLIGTIAAFLTATIISIMITRGVVSQLLQSAQVLSEGSAQTASAAHEISRASQSLAAGASEQAASLEETSASLEEVASMTKRNAQNAQSARELSGQARHTAEIGAAGMQAMARSTEGIRHASSEMRATMDGIREASADVSKIIKTIDEIAFQTNLLALNAAVEAARAGEAGMGFAVVADEVRNLAQRSAKAARETSDMIEASIKRSEEGVKVTEKVSHAVEDVAAKARDIEKHLADILTKSQQVDEQVAHIASASNEQSQGISQVAVAVTQMDKVTQSNAASAEESASAAEELNAQAVSLRAAVAELEKLSGATKSHGASAPASPIEHVAVKTPKLPAKRSTERSASSSSAKSPVPATAGVAPADFRDF